MKDTSRRKSELPVCRILGRFFRLFQRARSQNRKMRHRLRRSKKFRGVPSKRERRSFAREMQLTMYFFAGEVFTMNRNADSRRLVVHRSPAVKRVFLATDPIRPNQNFVPFVSRWLPSASHPSSASRLFRFCKFRAAWLHKKIESSGSYDARNSRVSKLDSYWLGQSQLCNKSPKCDGHIISNTLVIINRLYYILI